MSRWRRVPGYAKTILLAQFALIVFLAIWTFLEFQHNLFLQGYVKASLQASVPVLQMWLPALLAMGMVTVYAKVLSRRKEAREEDSREEIELPSVEIPGPSLLYPDEVMTGLVRKPVPHQLIAILAPKKGRPRTSESQRRRTIPRRRLREETDYQSGIRH